MYIALIVLNNAGGSMSSRLFQEVREQRGLDIYLLSYHSSLIETAVLSRFMGTGSHQLDVLYDTRFTKRLGDSKDKGITDKELC